MNLSTGKLLLPVDSYENNLDLSTYSKKNKTNQPVSHNAGKCADQFSRGPLKSPLTVFNVKRLRDDVNEYGPLRNTPK